MLVGSQLQAVLVGLNIYKIGDDSSWQELMVKNNLLNLTSIHFVSVNKQGHYLAKNALKLSFKSHFVKL